jgi:hypothetical protein
MAAGFVTQQAFQLSSQLLQILVGFSQIQLVFRTWTWLILVANSVRQPWREGRILVLRCITAWRWCESHRRRIHAISRCEVLRPQTAVA